jgi:catechol 2,3-dioxygenase-like lactoylglutathione lyase family enzyme
MQLPVARHTERLRGHDGYDGVFLAVPGTGAHLEFTAGGGHRAPAPHPESLLVLYLGDDATVQTVAARLGIDPVPPANPYWAKHGLTFEDPDGFRVVLVPEHWEN